MNAMTIRESMFRNIGCVAVLSMDRLFALKIGSSGDSGV